jgi:hypothetical protein
VTLGRQVDLKLVTGSGEAFRLPALVTVFWDFTSTYSRLNQSGGEKITVHLASKASHGCSDSHTPGPLQRFFTDLSKKHYNHARSHCARYNIPFRQPFPVFSLDNSSPPARISQSYCDFFRFALLPIDAKHQRSNRINQNKTTPKPMKKNVSVIPSRFFHSRRCIGQFIGRLKQPTNFSQPGRLNVVAAALRKKQKVPSARTPTHPTAERQSTIPQKKKPKK